MNFRRFQPTGDAAKAIDCYWIARDNNLTPVKQKIIPDGFTEIIIHYGDPYRINLEGDWATQSKRLLAGQISKHFYLENSGASDMLGIKFMPTAIAHLFGVSMKDIADKVVDLDTAIDKQIIVDENNVDDVFNELCRNYPSDHPADRAVELIFSKKGMISIKSVCDEISVGERSLQQMFQKYVGLTPKFFARVVRFSHIFNCIKEQNPDWAEIVYEAGYYDQSHFIRNFKAFTGEDPSAYIFAEKNLANFFMKKGEKA